MTDAEAVTKAVTRPRTEAVTEAEAESVTRPRR